MYEDEDSTDDNVSNDEDDSDDSKDGNASTFPSASTSHSVPQPMFSPSTPSDPNRSQLKWTSLEHKGPIFAPPYEPLPPNVTFRYDGMAMRLSPAAEEVAGLYAHMINHEDTTKEVFNTNFFKDWRQVMTSEEEAKIEDLRKCDFKEMHAFFAEQSERNRNRTKEEKAALKAKNEEIQKEYGYCIIDGHKEKIGNFRIEPPGLFRGRGEHPKMGMLKKRVMPEDVTINCSEDKIPAPPEGHKWKQVYHKRKVEWLASWVSNVQEETKYIQLDLSSTLKGETDRQKYETARQLHKFIDKIREEYRADWNSKSIMEQQKGVALYFIDKLAFRAGNEKDDDKADTVGCCSLRVEHIELHREKDGQEYVVVFDFPGKDAIRYRRDVPVEKRAFENLQQFKENKDHGDDLFDRLSTSALNEHLKEFLPTLTTKVFRTYTACITMERELIKLTAPNMDKAEKIKAYKAANWVVATLCNHRKHKNDRIATTNSKLFYIDPRITVAWCKKYGVPLKLVFSERQRERFAWAIQETDENFMFADFA